MEGAREDLKNARASLLKFREQLQKLGILRDLPSLGTQIRALEDAASAGSETLGSADDILDVAAVILDALQSGVETSDVLKTGIAPTRKFEELTTEEKRDLLQRFSNELPRLRSARDKMDIALTLWGRVPKRGLGITHQQRARTFGRSHPTHEKIARRSRAFARSASSHVRISNATPLSDRASKRGRDSSGRRIYWYHRQHDVGRWNVNGICFYGRIQYRQSRVRSMERKTAGSSHAIHRSFKLVFARRQLVAGFSNVGRACPGFFIRESELQLHAQLPARPTTFIALEPGFFRSLLELTGPLEVDGKKYDSDNFFEQLEFQVEVGFHQQGIPVEQRKEVISKLGAELTKRFSRFLPAVGPKCSIS